MLSCTQLRTIKNSKYLPPPLPLPSLVDIDVEFCGICDVNVTESDKAIECNKCQKWIHIKCNKITDRQYKHFQGNPKEIFECKNCNKCNICEKTIAPSHKAIECKICLRKVHIKCNKFDNNDYNSYQNDKEMQLPCIKCLTDTLPFLNLDNNKFNLAIKGIDCPDEVNISDVHLNSAQLDMADKINRAISNNLNPHNEDTLDTNNVTKPIDCQYYTINQFNFNK